MNKQEIEYPRFNHNYLQCPICDGDWDGGDIAEKLFEKGNYPTMEAAKEAATMYGWSEENKIRFKNTIGIEILGEYDGVSRWQCPHCKSEWDRFNNLLLVDRGVPLEYFDVMKNAKEMDDK